MGLDSHGPQACTPCPVRLYLLEHGVNVQDKESSWPEVVIRSIHVLEHSILNRLLHTVPGLQGQTKAAWLGSLTMLAKWLYGAAQSQILK